MAQRHRIAPWIFVLTFGAVASLILVGVSAYRVEYLVWLTLHPEALGGGLAAVAGAIGKGVSMLPHFRNGPTPREIDTARERLYAQVIEATDTLTAVQGELDLLYSHVVQLRDSIPRG